MYVKVGKTLTISFSNQYRLLISICICIIDVFWRDTFEGSKELSSLRNATFRVLARHTQEAKKVLC